MRGGEFGSKQHRGTKFDRATLLHNRGNGRGEGEKNTVLLKLGFRREVPEIKCNHPCRVVFRRGEAGSYAVCNIAERKG